MAASVSMHNASQLPGTLRATRATDFPSWFREVICVADLASQSAVPGCMVVHNMGCELWEQVKTQFDSRLKEGRHAKNYYFPALIPVSLFAKEVEHVEGFASECAVVTHSRMKIEGGKVIPDPAAQLDEPLIVRPTSETIIGETMRQTIGETNELPFKVNQWCNVFRWERHTRPFLRTLEFWWQEGHCAFRSQAEAEANALLMANVYELFMREVCALPVIPGRKSPGERFAGADDTFCLEAMMQDGKAVQAGTSHYLGQHFAKASEIRLTNAQGEKEYVHTTSWGISTRLIGAMIMVHSDDFGFRCPPRLSVYHVVILPAAGHIASEERDQHIVSVRHMLVQHTYASRVLSVKVDDREKLNAGEKRWDWRAKGAPICLEIGPREAKTGTVTLYRRDEDFLIGTSVKIGGVADYVIGVLGEIHTRYYEQADKFLRSHIRTDITNMQDLREFFGHPENTGFVRAPWFEDKDTESWLKDLHVTIRCLPLDQTGEERPCVLTGRPTRTEAIFGKSY